METKKPKEIILEQFAYRIFDKNRTSNYINLSKEDFTKKVNELYKSESQLVDGYAPFCKHLFVENFVKDLKSSHIEITPETEKLIISKYDARQKGELPVLIRYIDLKTIDKNKIPDAKYLDLILYSKEQIVKENIAMKFPEEQINEIKNKDFDWGIISIKPLNVNHEIPFVPITIMRNALGVSEGGSGEAIDREKYMKGVEFWSKNVELR